LVLEDSSGVKAVGGWSLSAGWPARSRKNQCNVYGKDWFLSQHFGFPLPIVIPLQFMLVFINVCYQKVQEGGVWEPSDKANAGRTGYTSTFTLMFLVVKTVRWIKQHSHTAPAKFNPYPANVENSVSSQ
jgi:hypothetical protein